MPTNRTLRVRKIVKQGISEIMRCYLETGDLFFSQASFPNSGGQFELFQIRHNRAELKKIWLENRVEILSDWKSRGKKGQPWAEREFSQKIKKGKRDAD